MATNARGISDLVGMGILLSVTLLVIIAAGALGVVFHTPELTTANPDSEFSFDHFDHPAGHDDLTITHAGGEGIPGDQLDVEITDTNDPDVDGTYTWVELGGDQRVVDSANVTVSAATVDPSVDALDLNDATVQLIVEDDNGEYVVDRWEGPGT